jgi:hypothetical protein
MALIGERRPCTASHSLAERIEIDLPEPRTDHRVLKLACRRIAGAGKCQSTRMFEHERASPAFGYDWTWDLTSFTRLQVAFHIPIECDDDMIGHWQSQAGFKLSAEDFPVRLSATTS